MNVTMTMEELDAIRNRAIEAETALVAFRREALAARQTDDTVIICAALQASIPLVQFAVANMSPEFQRGWPTATLREYAQALGRSPLADEFITEFANDLQAFANEADQVDRLRTKS
jgi:hypothetical protein